MRFLDILVELIRKTLCSRFCLLLTIAPLIKTGTGICSQVRLTNCADWFVNKFALCWLSISTNLGSILCISV